MNWLEAENNLPGDSRFEKLYLFLVRKRTVIEKIIRKGEFTSNHSIANGNKSNKQVARHTSNVSDINQITSKANCLIHKQSSHFTRKCNQFLDMSTKERALLIRKSKGCKLCLSTNHLGLACPFEKTWNPCKIEGCEKWHSRLLHEAASQGLLGNADVHAEQSNGISTSVNLKGNTLLLAQSIPTTRGSISAFYDSGSTISLVSKAYVKRHKMKGVQISYDLLTVGGYNQPQISYLHEMTLVDRKGNPHEIQAFQIDEICGNLQEVNTSILSRCFEGVSTNDLERPKNPIELLIGMKEITIHPKAIKESYGLVLHKSPFGSGFVIGGHYKSSDPKDQFSSFVEIVAHSKISNTRVMFKKHADPGIDFFSAEEFGVKVSPKCKRCVDCKNCTKDMCQLSREEQRELAVIKENLQLDPITSRWTTQYPYKEDPAVLEDNRIQALAMLSKTERRLLKSPTASEKYKQQFDDFIQRGVLRELQEDEIQEYVGPVFYATHHEVFKEDSISTPVRLVINSSLKYKGKSLNDILMKGPNTLNDILGVQLRFRSYTIPLVCDISKMYHSVHTTERETHLRRVLWRNLDTSQPVKTYGIERVTFGDRPAAAIASIAMLQTAELYKDLNPEAAKQITTSSYVDDIVTGAESYEAVEVLKSGIKQILEKGGFQIKGFVTAGQQSQDTISLLGTGELGRVLGIQWEPRDDVFTVKVRINLSTKYKSVRKERDYSIDEIPLIQNMKITKRLLLSVTNSCYDPIGLVSPITIRMKIALRMLYSKELNISWDDDLPNETKRQWTQILTTVKKAEDTKFKRCIKPERIIGKPDLIICNDGSELAMCATAHVRWETEEGVKCTLWAAKTRVTPLQRSTIPRIEMQSAILGVRLAELIKKNSIWEFRNIYHLTDSKCLLAILRKDSTALREFMGNRVSEILETTTIEQWYHVRSKDNISDLGTRGNATIADIDVYSEWQNGPSWSYLPINQWPISQEVDRSEIPTTEIIGYKIAASAVAEKPAIDYEKYRGKTYDFAKNLTALLIRIAKNKSFKQVESNIDDLKEAESFMMKSSMKFTKQLLDDGKLTSLRPEMDADGIIKLGSRALQGMNEFYETKEFPILAYKDPLAYLWIKKIHKEDHSGITRTVAKSRRKFWIIKARRLATAIKRSCYKCRLIDKRLTQQLMAPLPNSRQIMSPPFHKISLDLFGPYDIKDTVKKRTRKKVWGLVINCLATRAVHIDITEDYDADSFLIALRRFMALRGYPALIVSDKGSQLVSASEELKRWAKRHEIEWKIVPAEGQHQNGCSESLIKSIKRSLSHVIGKNVLTFSSLQMLFYEVANLINARPIGIVSGSDPTQPSPITPNHLILGRSTAEVIQGSFDESKNPNKRLQFIQSLVDDWWKCWYQKVLPSLVPSYKWHQRHRNVQVGDVCLIRYKGELKNTYKLGQVKSIQEGTDGLVRKVTLAYRNPNETQYREVDRPIHGIAVIVPIEEQTVFLNPEAKTFEPEQKSA